MLDRTTLGYLPGETVGGRYHRLVQYARTFDSRFVEGAASVPEVDRVEKAIASFKRQAEEKKAEEARKANNTPERIAGDRLAALWHRANDARGAISRMQMDAREYRYRPEWKILALPPEFFEEPDTIRAPSFKTLEEVDGIASELGDKASSLEGLRSELRGFIDAWKAGGDKWTLKVFETLHNRVLALEYRSRQ
jgi:hypothetical protein